MAADNADIITGFPSIIDVPTFIDFIIINEFSSNVDAYQISTFFHKDKGGKLRAGPVWDFNLSFGHDEFGDRSQPDVWQFDNEDNEGPRFWKQLFANDEFKCYLSKRWNALTAAGQPLNYNSVDAFIDEAIELISEAAIREQERWGTVPNLSADITAMKAFISERMDWMTDNVGTFVGCNDVALPPLVISIINYNPDESTEFPESDEQEFIGITNTGAQAIDLSGIYLSELGISYQFPPNSTVLPGHVVYIASNPEVFMAKYSKQAVGQYQRNLSNNSQKLVLADAFGNVIDMVEYDDENPWPDADGNGFYLQLTDVALDNSLASSWTASDEQLGITSFTEGNDIVVYPNPVYVTLTIRAAGSINNVEIYDIYGKIVYQQNSEVSQLSIDFSSYSAGIYIVKVTNDKGSKIQKIIKQ